MHANLTPYEDRVKTGLIKSSRHETLPLIVYNYTDKCIRTDAWDEFTKLARGIVFDTETGEVVSKPYSKFFGHRESMYSAAPDAEYVAMEKIDGTMGTVFFYRGEWRVATRGYVGKSIHTDIGKRILDRMMPKLTLDPDYTYVVEIVNKDIRVKIDYGDVDTLFCLGVIKTSTGDVLFPSKENLSKTGFDVGGYEDRSLSVLMEEANSTLPADKEGWVVHYNNPEYGRFKIKGKNYLNSKQEKKVDYAVIAKALQNGVIHGDHFEGHEELISKVESDYKTVSEYVYNNVIVDPSHPYFQMSCAHTRGRSIDKMVVKCIISSSAK